MGARHDGGRDGDDQHRCQRRQPTDSSIRLSPVRLLGARRIEHDLRHAFSVAQVDDPVLGAFVPSPDDVMGLTFVLDRCDSVTVSLADGQAVTCDAVHDADKTIASVPWRPLVFPDLD